jgi:starch-binding outer membrane protein, SusD/RagB family
VVELYFKIKLNFSTMKLVNYKSISVLLFGFIVAFSSCFNDLNTTPLDPDEVTSELVFSDADSYKQFLAKIYAGLALSGQQGPAGQPDISGIDEGFSTYLRQYWKAQELSTDEAVIAWNDGNIHDYEQQDWDAANEFVTAMYNRIMYQVVLCNEFIRESEKGKLDDRGITGPVRDEIPFFRAEARFLRALSYWHGLDMFRNMPFVTEDDKIGAFFPEQTNAEDLFNYLEAELLAIETELAAPQSNEYGRADQAAAWMLLAKLYLNAEVYVGRSYNDQCITYCKKVIDSGYTLDADYQALFRADNNEATGLIFPVRFDGEFSRTWGGMTFIIHASVGGSMDPAASGIDNGWGGIRTTSAHVAKFDTLNDGRAMFYTDGQSLEIESVADFTDGWAINKFTNLDKDGNFGSDPDNVFPDTDFPMFRLADAYLMYAEAIERGGAGGDISAAVGYINDLRERGFGNSDHNITEGELNLDFILDERARELYWECHRRTDLIRYGRFSESTYIWPWKGNVAEGESRPAFYDVFPIPATDLTANPNLKQNTGY